jgi:hypothetical protein
MHHLWERWPGAGHSGAALVRSVRLWAGVVLCGYVITHLANHALGLISLQAMDNGRAWFLWPCGAIPSGPSRSTGR